MRSDRHAALCGAIMGLVILPAAAACSAGSGAREAAPNARSAPSFVRTCESAVAGTLPRGWKRTAMFAGPVALYTFGSIRSNGHVSRHYPITKVLVLVRPMITVRLVVPSAERATFALLYDPSKFTTATTPEQGEASVIFRGCQPSGGGGDYLNWTQYNGGFIEVRRQCAHLSVTTATGAWRLTASLGAGHCA